MPDNIFCAAQTVALAEMTTMGVGGSASRFYQPRTVDSLRTLVARLHADGERPFFLGAGSNTVCRSGEIDRPVVSLRALKRSELRGETLYVQAGVMLLPLVRRTAEEGLSGLEPLVGIPGSIGGAIAMNAGGRHGTIRDLIEEVEFVEPNGRLVRRPRGELNFSYRRGPQSDAEVIVGARLRLARERPEAVLERMRRILREKVSRQPLAARSAGCVFRNPPGASAGYLIERVGLRGHRLGGARFSERHANFIVNAGGATFDQVVELMRLAARRVLDAFGVTLEPEITIL